MDSATVPDRCPAAAERADSSSVLSGRAVARSSQGLVSPGPAGVHQKSGRTGDVLLLDSLMLRVLVVASALSAAAAFSPIATLPRTAARNYHFNLEVLLLYFEQTC